MDEPKPPKLPMIFPCSGAADTGAIGDAAARRLSARNVAKMYCLAGIGARVEEIVSNTDVAEALVALDGCDNDCSRKVLEAAGFTPVLHLRITDLGMTKGQTPLTDENIESAAAEVLRRLDGLGGPLPDVD
jgi:uncharacterized metal-binding protein